MRDFECAGRRIEHNTGEIFMRMSYTRSANCGTQHAVTPVKSRNSPENLQSFVPVPQDRTIINACFIGSKFAFDYHDQIIRQPSLSVSSSFHGLKYCNDDQGHTARQRSGYARHSARSVTGHWAERV